MSNNNQGTSNVDTSEEEVTNMGLSKQRSKTNIIAVVVVIILLAIIGLLIKRSLAATRITNPYACGQVNGSFPEVKLNSKDGDTGIAGEQCVSAVQWDIILSRSIHHFDPKGTYALTVTGTYDSRSVNEAKLMQKYFNWTNVNGEWGAQEIGILNAFVPFKALSSNTTPPPTGSSSYDNMIINDKPVGYWTLGEGSGTADDATSKNLNGKYNGSTSKTSLPNGEGATAFTGKSGSYVQIPDADQLSIPTTKTLTWEAWVRPDTLAQASATDDYTNFLGKCADYSPTCEWEGRMYNTKTPNEGENRCNRISAYVFNTSAGLGSAGDWQPKCGLVQAGQWLHVVGSYQTSSTPSDCPVKTPAGSIDIWVNGVLWNAASHRDTGCMSQYKVTPKNSTSPFRIGTMADEYWFQGAVGKVAIYDYRLTQAQITAHYKAMTSRTPAGSCASSCTLAY